MGFFARVRDFLKKTWTEMRAAIHIWPTTAAVPLIGQGGPPASAPKSRKKVAPVQQPAQSTTPTPSTKLEEYKGMNRRGILFFSAVLTLVVVIASYNIDIGTLAFAAWIFSVGQCLHAVRDPNIGLLFQMDRCVGTLRPGWYLCIPHFFDVEEIPIDYTNLTVEGDFHTKEMVPVKAKLLVSYRVAKKKVEKIISMRPSKMQERAFRLVESKVRTKIGEMTFKELLGKQGDIEEAVLLKMRKEFSKDGYEIRDAELYRINDNVISDGEVAEIAIKKKGLAEAEVLKQKTEAIAGPLKDNWPAALYSIGASFSDRDLRNFGSTEKAEEKPQEGPKEKKEAQKGRTDASRALGIVDRVTNFVNNFFNQGRPKKDEGGK